MSNCLLNLEQIEFVQLGCSMGEIRLMNLQEIKFVKDKYITLTIALILFLLENDHYVVLFIEVFSNLSVIPPTVQTSIDVYRY